MRGLKKNRMGRGHIYIYIHTWTSRLLDRIGPVGRFDEEEKKLNKNLCVVEHAEEYSFFSKLDETLGFPYFLTYVQKKINPFYYSLSLPTIFPSRAISLPKLVSLCVHVFLPNFYLISLLASEVFFGSFSEVTTVTIKHKTYINTFCPGLFSS